MPPTPLAPGFHPLPAGHLATVVTHLRMTAPPPAAPAAPAAPADVALARIADPDPAAYRALFRRVGTPWLWQSRLRLDDAALAGALARPGTELWVPRRDGRDVGLLELAFEDDVAEIAFFGLVPDVVGTGLGRWLMGQALARAWDRGRPRPIRRLDLHTCTLDHPAALRFYLRAGFAIHRQEVEVLADPRLDGTLPRGAGPHVPLAVEVPAPPG